MERNLFFKTKKLWVLAVAMLTALPMLAANQAKIGDTEYATLQAAINAAKTGETVTLISNVTTSNRAISISGKTLILDLNGFNITRSDYAPTVGALTIENASNVTINDENNTGQIKGNGCAVSVTGKNNTLTINGGSYTCSYDGTFATINVAYASWMITDPSQYNNNKVIVNGGKFDAPNNSRAFNNATGNEQANITINGGTFTAACNLKGEYIADDCALQQNSDGSYTAVKDNNTEIYYTTGTVSKNAVSEGPKVLLTDNDITLKDGSLNDIENFYSFVVPADVTGKNITYTRQFGNTTWNAWYVPFDIEAGTYSSSVEFYTFDAVTETDGNWKFTVSPITGTIKANTPYLVKPKEVGTVTFTVNDATIYKTTNATQEFKAGSSVYTITGTYNKKFTLLEKNWYALANDGTFSKQTTGSYTRFLYPFRFYLEITGSSQSKPVGIMVNDDATGIDNVKVETSKDNIVYDLQGRRVSQPAKGIYIVNGKKVLVK